MLKMQYNLWEAHKDKWEPMEPLYARESLLWMIEEVGEVISIIKKKGEDNIQSDPHVKAAFTEELCDVLMYYLDTLNRYGISAEDLSKAFAKKHNYNMKRDFSAQHDNFLNPDNEQISNNLRITK